MAVSDWKNPSDDTIRIPSLPISIGHVMSRGPTSTRSTERSVYGLISMESKACQLYLKQMLLLRFWRNPVNRAYRLGYCGIYSENNRIRPFNCGLVMETLRIINSRFLYCSGPEV